MVKRFTETTKWRDRWFLSLTPAEKLAWQFICDECDHAGVIELVGPLVALQIGLEVDWEVFVAKCAHRVVDLGDGKLWVRAFCDFQYGTLNPENRVHCSVLKRIEEMGLARTLNCENSSGFDGDMVHASPLKNKPLTSPLLGAKDKYKDKDKDKDQEKDLGGGVGEEEPLPDPIHGSSWVIPEHLDTNEVRLLLDRFAAMRLRIKKPIRDFANSSLTLKRFDDVDHLIFALETCIANDYQGLKPEYRPPERSVARAGKPKTFGQQKSDNTAAAFEEVFGDG